MSLESSQPLAMPSLSAGLRGILREIDSAGGKGLSGEADSEPSQLVRHKRGGNHARARSWRSRSRVQGDDD
jgi:hypothetical protein